MMKTATVMSVFLAGMIVVTPMESEAVMLHLTDNYGAQSTSGGGLVVGLLNLEVHADDFAGLGGNAITAVEFGVSVPPPTGLTWLGDTTPWPVTLGDSQNGISIALGALTPEPVHLLTIQYFDMASGPTDQLMQIVPHPVTGKMVVIDGNFVEHPITYASGFLYNPSGAVPDPQWTPEPATLGLLAVGSLGIAARRRRRK